MKSIKNLGIWMDHSNAYEMDFTNNIIQQNRVDSDFTHEDKEMSLSKNENLMHNKEQQHMLAYFKKLAETIKKYTHVVLFGPTAAKTELVNLLKGDHHFEHIKIEVKNADKMTENQMHSFVRNYFK